MKLILGKHNLSAPMTSYSRPEVMVKSQSYFFTHSVKAMAVTQTAKGITSKQLLIGTIGDQVCCLVCVSYISLSYALKGCGPLLSSLREFYTIHILIVVYL
jgi:hypothetical protein